MTATPDGTVAGVVLAAGAGTRLRPLTQVLPKALCPVGGVPLVDLAVERLRAVTGDVAVNVHHGREALEAHLDGRGVRVSVEAEEALGTAGAVGRLRPWIEGRPTLVVNADAWTTAPLAPLLGGWDGERIRVLVVVRTGPPAVSASMRLAGALLPWWSVEPLRAEPSGLWEVSWREAASAGRVEAVGIDAAVPFVDCGTPAAYLAANLAASGGATVVGEGAVVHGRAERSVLWPGTVVHEGEHLVDAVRADARTTVLVR